MQGSGVSRHESMMYELMVDRTIRPLESDDGRSIEAGFGFNLGFRLTEGSGQWRFSRWFRVDGMLSRGPDWSGWRDFMLYPRGKGFSGVSGEKLGRLFWENWGACL